MTTLRPAGLVRHAALPQTGRVAPARCLVLALVATMPSVAPAQQESGGDAVAATADPASTSPSDTIQIIVLGRAEAKIGAAQAASLVAIAGQDLLVWPLMRTAELLEAVPGMIAAQHSGSGKHNQYFLRGLNIDHGSDFADFIDGVPMNLRTDGHGQGFSEAGQVRPYAYAQYCDIRMSSNPICANPDKSSALRGALRFKPFEVVVEVLNALGSRGKGIAYWHEVYVPAVNSTPIEGRFSRVVEPQTLRIGVRLNFSNAPG